jgi:cell wall-associated NlpC family hydrolase
MQSALISLALSGLGRDALKVAVSLVLALLLALAFAISSLSAVLMELGGLGSPGSLAGTPTSPAPSASGNQIVRLALAQIGTPYVWGGTDPATGVDCSGLVQWVYRQVGIALPRTAQEQYDATTRVPRDQLQPGDMVFFASTYASDTDWITHVGIYVGNGQMVNAPTDGDVVRTMPVFSGFWGAHYAGAGRPGG